MKLKNPQAKGKRAEYETRNILRGFGFEAERQPMSGAISFLKGDIRTDFPFFCEVKNVEKTTFSKWYKKALDQAGSKPPIIIWTRNNEDYYCFLKFTDFLSALMNKPIVKFKKPEKAKRLPPEEQSKLQFSKQKQVHR